MEEVEDVDVIEVTAFVAADVEQTAAEEVDEEDLMEAEEFVMTLRAVLTANDVGVERLIGGVLAFGGGGNC